MDQHRRELLRKAAAAAAAAAVLARFRPAGAFCPRGDDGRVWRLAGRGRTLAEKGRPPRR